MHRSYAFLLVAVLTVFELSGAPPLGEVTSTHAQSDGMLILNEISPWPADSEVWVELLNPSDRPVELDGWSIEFLSGFRFTFAPDSGEVPGGGVHVLRITDGNPLNPEGDGCTLSGPDGPVDAITWGTVPLGAFPLHSGSPLWPEYEVYMEEDELFSPDDVLIRIPDTWPPSSEQWVGSRFWAYRSVDSASPGEPNLPPGPLFLTPRDGARIASRFHLSVGGLGWAREMTFQVASDAAFSDIIIQETVEGHSLLIDDLPAGMYYWRVRGEAGSHGPWSRVQQFTRLPFDVDDLIAAAEGRARAAPESSEARLASRKGGGEEAPEGLAIFEGERLYAHHVIGLTHLQQRKDSIMVCLDGCNRYTDFPWNEPHPQGPRMEGGHKEMYCVRACLAMIAAQSGCTLSQDRISYYIFEEAGVSSRGARETGHIGDPIGDLGHKRGVGGRDMLMALEWVYGESGARPIIYEASAFDDTDPSDMDTIREFIDDNRPVIKSYDRHSTVVDGYAIVLDEAGLEQRMIHVLDPWNVDDLDWEELPMIVSDDPPLLWFTLPPPTGRPSRCDEPDLNTDSDRDTLSDFDETNRFLTDPHDPDTDGDGLNDMRDMIGYIFDADGNYNLREPDFDGDGDAKELDFDNDRDENDGMSDGCEDADLDGFFTPDGMESDNFDGDDDFSVINPDCYSGYIVIESEVGHAGFPGASVTVYEQVTIESRRPISWNDYVHEHVWELSGDPFEMAIPATPGSPGGVIRSTSAGEGEGIARVTIDIDENGNYTVTADCDPRVVTYTITTTGPGVNRTTTEDFHLALGDHHYEYVSPEAPAEVFVWLGEVGPANVFEGIVEVMPEGGTRIAGDDTITIPSSVGGGILTGSATRAWEIWIEPPGRD